MSKREEILTLANELNFPALNDWGKDRIEAFYHAARSPLNKEIERLKQYEGYVESCAEMIPGTGLLAVKIKWLQEQLASAQARIAELEQESGEPPKISGFERSLASVDAYEPQSFIDGSKWAESKLYLPRTDYGEAMSKNDITGDKITTKPSSREQSDKFEAGFERIFGVKCNRCGKYFPSDVPFHTCSPKKERNE